MILGYHRAKVFGAAFDGSNQEKLGEAVTGTNTYYSLPVRLPRENGQVSVHAGWTGTTSGTITLWYSNLAYPDPTSDTDWQEDTNFATAFGDPAGAPGGSFAQGFNAAGGWCRLKYVSAAGTGTLWAIITAGV